MTKKIIFNIILLLSWMNVAVCQEITTGLQSEPALSGKHLKFSASKGLAADTLDLPYFDDFSVAEIYPDPVRWTDDNVFINNTYTHDQITTGVVTFDALDNSGRLYETASNILFEADHLTSQPVSMELLPSDSVRLSFYYQSAGLGDIPEANDSLTLQFFAPEEAKWYPVWRAEGGSYSRFKAVILRIEDPKFLHKGFRFRFINYASLSSNLSEPSIIGNCDHWNIDYVLLDKARNDADTVFHDVALRYPHRSLLNSHESMPWKHFLQVYLQEMASSIPIHYRNNDVIVRNVTRNFEIYDMYENSLVKSLTAGATNVAPGTDADDLVDLIYTFGTVNNDSALFRIKSWLITDIFDPKENDTLTYIQKFSNYFAFDDGSSEGGYGINGLGSRNAMVAYRFKSFVEDTLRAIQICFNDSYLNSNLRIFDLMVWDDNGGVPGNVLYTQERAMVQQGEAVNGFYEYLLRKGVPVKDVFYAGWKQRSETFLNAGLDLNTSHNGKQFYWINGNWIQSTVNGSLMIRPVTGYSLLTSIRDIISEDQRKLRIYPNPAADFINVTLAGSFRGNTYLSFVDLHGREVYKVLLSERIDISALHDGIYIVIATKDGIPFAYNRLIKTR